MYRVVFLTGLPQKWLRDKKLIWALLANLMKGHLGISYYIEVSSKRWPEFFATSSPRLDGSKAQPSSEMQLLPLIRTVRERFPVWQLVKAQLANKSSVHFKSRNLEIWITHENLGKLFLNFPVWRFPEQLISSSANNEQPSDLCWTCAFCMWNIATIRERQGCDEVSIRIDEPADGGVWVNTHPLGNIGSCWWCHCPSAMYHRFTDFGIF